MMNTQIKNENRLADFSYRIENALKEHTMHLLDEFCESLSEDEVQNAMIIMAEYANRQNCNAEELLAVSASQYLMGDFAGSEKTVRRSMELSAKEHGEHSFEVSTCLNNIARLYELTGRSEEAFAYHEQALAIRRTLRNGTSDLAFSLVNYATALAEYGLPEKAEPLFGEAVALYETLGMQDTAIAHTAQNNFAICRRKRLHNELKTL